MAHKQSGELRKRCQLAKQRLKMGYWDSIREGRNTQPTDSVAIPDNARLRLRRELTCETTESVADERMYKKVCDILDSDEVALNPIGQLIESDVYTALDAAGKQRYILELSNKFRELKDRYYRERTGA